MPRPPAKTFADRLPPVVPREETDISHLSDEMAEILYPGRRERPFRIGVAFDPFEGPNYPRAVDLARRAHRYGEHGEGDAKVHLAEFGVSEAVVLRELFEIVGRHAGTEVTVDGKKVPYARELWLPLVWLFIREP